MRLSLAFAAVAALLFAPHVSAARPAARPAAATDWTRTVTATPAGAYVMGNPAAPVKLVEYLSLTCSHCAAFAREGMPKLLPLIRAGRVSLEVRHAIRDRYDIVASLLARCSGASGYFPALERLFARQEGWLQTAVAWERGGGDVSAQAPDEALATIADKSGLAAALGMPLPRAKSCVADARQQRLLGAMRGQAWDEQHISGTPAFVVNGKAVDAHDWASLEPALRTAPGAR